MMCVFSSCRIATTNLKYRTTISASLTLGKSYEIRSNYGVWIRSSVLGDSTLEKLDTLYDLMMKNPKAYAVHQNVYYFRNEKKIVLIELENERISKIRTYHSYEKFKKKYDDTLKWHPIFFVD